MATLTNTRGEVIDMATGEVVGRAEGAPVTRDPRAKGPEEAVSDPISGLIRNASWGLSTGLFALPDLAVKGIGKVLGLDDENVMTLTKLYNQGAEAVTGKKEVAPRNEQERYARAIGEGIGGGLLPTGVLSFIARGRPFASMATPNAGVFKQIANDTLDFVKKDPKLAFAMDAAFGAAHETLRQAVEENMSDDDPERKAFFKDYMPTAALIGLPLAAATLSPTGIAYRFGKNKLTNLNNSLGDLEKGAISDLPKGYQLPLINFVPKVFASRAKDKLVANLGASINSPEGSAASAELDEIFKNYSLLAEAGYKANIAEQTMDPAIADRSNKAIANMTTGSVAQKALISQKATNDTAFAYLFDNLTPKAGMELQAALGQVQQQRQQLFDSLAANRTDITQDELTRLGMFYGPLNPDKLNGELRGMLQAQVEADVGMRKNILRRMGLGQGTDKDGLPLPVRDDKGQSLFAASNVEQPALDLLSYYDTLLKGRTTMATEMRSFIAKSEPLNTLRKNVTSKIKARDDMEAKLNEEILFQKYTEALQDTQLAAKMKMPLRKDFAAGDNKTIQDTFENLRLLIKPNPTKKELIDIKVLGNVAKYNSDTGDVRLLMGMNEGRPDVLTMNVKTIGQDAKRVAAANTAVDMNVPEAIDYLEAAARFRNQALDKHNAVLAGSRQTRTTDADQYLTLGNKVYDDFEKMILNNVPRLKQERQAMKIVLDDYRSVYERRLPLIIGKKVNEGGATRYSTPNEQVLSAAFRSAEDVRDLSALIGNNPIGLNLLEKGTLNWLQSKKIFDNEGLISPKKINDVLQKNQNIISALPKQVQDTLKNEADTAVNISRRLGEIRQQEITARDVEFDNFLTKVLRPGTDNEIILTQAFNSPIEMTRLVNAVKGDPNKLEALQAAVFGIAKQGVTTGGSLKKFMELSDKSLKVVFNENHLKDLNALASIQERNAILNKVLGTAPKFESTSQLFQRMMGISIAGLATTSRDVVSTRISPQGAGITLGVRLFSSMEEDLQNKMMVRALTDPKLAKALAKGNTPEEGKILLREMQSMGYLSRSLLADIGVTSSQLAIGDKESPIGNMIDLSPIVRQPAASVTESQPATAAALLKKMPPAPQTRGMPNMRVGPPPAAPAAPASSNLMYPTLFPNDPISKMLLQRQQQVAPPQ